MFSAIAIIIFVITLTLIIWQPKGLNIGWSAAGGAALALLAGAVDFGDVWAVTQMVWNATLAFIAAVIISLILDEIGFFEWAALHMARLAGGSGKRMFVYIVLLGAAVSIFFNNDGGVLILTPIVLAMVRALQFDDRMILPFIMAGGFIADTASVPLIISNLVNIISSDFFDIGFVQYAVRMIVPALFSIAASLLVLYLFFRRSIPDRYDPLQLREPSAAIRDPRLFRMSWPVLAVLLAAYFVSEWTKLPVSLMAGAVVLVFLLMAGRSAVIKPRKLVRNAPWNIIVFSIGMYVVVYGLKNAGLTEQLGRAFQFFADQGLYFAAVGGGFLAAVLSSVMNNLPTVMIDALAIDSTHTAGVLREALIFANVIGSDLGPKITPIGSLATLLWLHILSAKGIRIGWGYYFKVGIVLTVPVLFATLSGLYLWLLLLSHL